MSAKPKDVIYDIETYPNFFSVVFYSVEKKNFVTFEISERRNDFKKLCATIRSLGRSGARMVGFNNFSFDYPVLHDLLTLGQSRPDASAALCCKRVMHKVDSIMATSFHDRFSYIIWDRDQICQQIDLFKIHHFDNVARSTSLKELEHNMRSESIVELPFKPNSCLTHDQMDELLEYNEYDVLQTYKFYLETLDAIALREKLSDKYERNFLNANDTKIGKTIFQIELEKAIGPECCYQRTPEGRRPRQTKRKSIAIGDVLLWYINFKRPEFNAVLDWLSRQTITTTKSVFTGLDIDELGSLKNHCDLSTARKKEWGKFEINDKGKKVAAPMVKNLNCVVDGLHFVFGTGGLHASVEPQTVESDEEKLIIDLDVVSYYPSLAITNEFAPAHLGTDFCKVYGKLKKQRVSYAKGTPENAALKLALNGVYGDSNSKYSPFYDPQYTMAITINGQLLLCMLSEWLMDIQGLQMIQANTDGITVKVPRSDIGRLETICKKWEALTGLELEANNYSRMFIRDVNNYVAEYEDGKVKRKGAYEYKIGWHQNHSALVVQKAVEAHLIDDIDVGDFIRNHANEHDFYLRAKVPKNSRLLIRYNVNGDGKVLQKQLQNISRYYISNNGGEFIKEMPPLAKAPDKVREIAINKGYKVTVHNELAPLDDVNFDWYIEQAQKLIDPLKS